MNPNHLNSSSAGASARADAPGRISRPPVRAVLIPRGLFVYFDLPLLEADILATNWRARANSRWLVLTVGHAYPNRCQFYTSVGEISVGLDIVTYLATVPDVQGVDLQYVVQFANFPLTLT